MQYLKSKTTIAAAVAMIGLGALVSTSIRKPTEPASSEASQKGSPQGKKELYQCSMHPSISSDHPDHCPICHMRLEKVDSDEPQTQAATATGEEQGKTAENKGRKILFYRHPMRGDITSPTPQKDEMGMDFIPVYEDEGGDGKPSGVQGRASFSLSTERQQLIGVTTTQAALRPLGYEIRASGRVAFDPELYTAVEEYRQALVSRGQMDAGPLKQQADELIASSRTKLRLMGLTDEQIRALSSGKSNSLNLLLPTGSVWIYAEVFEYEVQSLKAGFRVEAESGSVPGKVFLGKVSSISPVVNSPSRTVRVRALIPDPERLLRPDMYVNVKIKVDLGDKLAVPENSILHSGDQTFVFIVKERGKFEPRPVRIGVKAQNFYEVLSGLQAGETVVTSANFLIDSESRLRGVLQNPGGSSQPPSGSAPSPQPSPDTRGRQ